MTTENPTGQRKMELGEESLMTLNKIRKWTLFLSVSGFIFLGLIIILGLLTGTFLTAFNNTDEPAGISDFLLLAGFAAAALVNFFPIIFLYRFSSHAANAVKTRNSGDINKAFLYLKRFFIYIGLLIIVLFVLYIALLIFFGNSFSSLTSH
jgi:hypothetical protein